MSITNPLWVNVTWGAGGKSFEITLDLCSHLVQNMGIDVLMHLTTAGMSKERISQALERAKAIGIKNILALRGDLSTHAKNNAPIENGFNYATDLVKYIRE